MATIKDKVRRCEFCGGTFKSIRPKVTVHGGGRPCMYIQRAANTAKMSIAEYVAKKGIARPDPINDVPDINPLRVHESWGTPIEREKFSLPTLQEAALSAGIVHEVTSPFQYAPVKNEGGPIYPLPQFPKPEPKEKVDPIKSLLLAGIEDIPELTGSEEIPFPEAASVAPTPAPKRSVRSRTHLVIPDCQVKEGVPTEHLEWIGKYIALKRPDVIVCIGDFGDMASLSLYDKGKKTFEGRTYAGDIQSVRAAMKLLVDQFRNIPGYNPRMILTLGNHEYRIIRACEIDRELSGTFKIEHLGYEHFGWEVYPFLDIVKVDGIEYSHYFTSGVMGRPVSSAAVLLRERQGSAIMGHNQMTDMAIHKKTQRIALMVGTCYLHDEPYLTPQGNDQRRQIIMLHEVDGDGHFDPMFVSLDYLSRRFGDGRQIYRGLPHEDRLPSVYTDDYEGRTPYGSQD